MKKYLISFTFLILSLGAFCGQGALLKGNRAYDAGKYGEAFEQYQKAAANAGAQTLQKAQYNSGAALYKLQDYDAAADAYSSSAGEQGILKQDAYFNLGNAYFRAKKNDEAIKSYRAALKINPQDKEALYNLQLILKQQQKQQQNNKQCNNPQQQENKDKNSSDGGNGQN